MIRLLMYIFPCLLFVTACEAPVDIAIEELDPKMVVISHCMPDSLFKVVVGISKTPTDTNDTISYLSDVRPQLRLMEGDELIFLEDLDFVVPTDEELEKGIPPYYTSRAARAEAGKQYRLNIYPLGTPVDAIETSATIPSAPAETELSVEVESGRSTLNGFEEVDFKINLTIHDRDFRQDFYHFDVVQELLRWRGGTVPGEIIVDTDHPELIPSLSFEIVDDDQEVLAYIGNRGVLIKDDNFNGESALFEFRGTLRFDPRRFVLGDFIGEVRHTSEAYYLYHSSLVRQVEVQGGFDPIAGAVILYNNIEDGCGIFAGYHPTFKRVKITN